MMIWINNQRCIFLTGTSTTALSIPPFLLTFALTIFLQNRSIDFHRENGSLSTIFRLQEEDEEGTDDGGCGKAGRLDGSG
jgi:hypothetical protein